MKQDIKRQFITAVAMGNKDLADHLRRQLLFAEEMPFFIEVNIKDGMYHLSWKDLVLTKEEFEELKAECPQQVFWIEEKTYEQASN